MLEWQVIYQEQESNQAYYVDDVDREKACKVQWTEKLVTHLQGKDQQHKVPNLLNDCEANQELWYNGLPIIVDSVLLPQDEDRPEQRRIQEDEREVDARLWNALIVIAVQ